MLCPVDATPLMMTDRSGVEIDYCPKCRGVWLDRGELDKIIDRSVAPPAAAPVHPAPPPEPPRAAAPAPGYSPQPRQDQRYRDDDDDDDRRYRKKRRESFLGELFDF